MKLEKARPCHHSYIADIFCSEGSNLNRNFKHPEDGLEYFVITEANLPIAVVTINSQKDGDYLDSLVLRTKNTDKDLYSDLLNMVDSYSKNNGRRLFL